MSQTRHPAADVADAQPDDAPDPVCSRTSTSRDTARRAASTRHRHAVPGSRWSRRRVRRNPNGELVFRL
jgi:hypothetical protein